MGRKSGICKRKDRQAEFWPCAGLRGREEIMEQKESRLKALKIGQLVAKRPVIQGGMGIGISLSSLAGAVAKAGGIGIISTAQIGFRDPDFEKNPLEANKQAIHQELKKAREIAPQGIIGFNNMAPAGDNGQYWREAWRAGHLLNICGGSRGRESAGIRGCGGNGGSRYERSGKCRFCSRGCGRNRYRQYRWDKRAQDNDRTNCIFGKIDTCDLPHVGQKVPDRTGFCCH